LHCGRHRRLHHLLHQHLHPTSSSSSCKVWDFDSEHTPAAHVVHKHKDRNRLQTMKQLRPIQTPTTLPADYDAHANLPHCCTTLSAEYAW
jgi:hypothetical protein